MIRTGGRVISADVAHRPRQQGVSNYGVFDRLWVGISDLWCCMAHAAGIEHRDRENYVGSQEPVE